MFLKPKLHKESKNGFKTINYRRYPVMIFSKNCFRSKKNHQKSWMFCWFLNFYSNIYGYIRPILKKIIAGLYNRLKYYQNVENQSIFSCDFFLESQVFSSIATIGFSWPQTPDFQSLIWKNWSVFNILEIFQLILNFFKKLV